MDDNQPSSSEPIPPAKADRPLTREVRVPVPTWHAAGRVLRATWFLPALSIAIAITSIVWSARTARHFRAFAQLSVALDAARDSSANLKNPFDSLFRAWEIQREIRNYSPAVDLTVSSLQPIDLTFSVAQLSVASVAGGARVSGLIINPESIDHESAEFEIEARDVKRRFSVFRLQAGGSSRFSVLLPGVNADSTSYASIRYISSTIGYRRPL